MTNSKASDPKKEATLNDVFVVLSETKETLDEMLVWLRVGGTEKVKSLLNAQLDKPEKRLIYQLSDGKSTREIGAICNIDNKTVSNYWRAWHRMGLMKAEKVGGAGYRYFRAFDLEDYGIPVPKPASNAKQEKTQDNSQATLNMVDVGAQQPAPTGGSSP